VPHKIVLLALKTLSQIAKKSILQDFGPFLDLPSLVPWREDRCNVPGLFVDCTPRMRQKKLAHLSQ